VKEMASNSEAFSVLYTRHFKWTRDVLMSHYRLTFHEAEDAAQKAFIKVFKNSAKFRGSCLFRTWLFTIARNVAYDGLREPGCKNLSLDSKVFEDSDFTFDVADVTSPTPSEAAENSDLAANIVQDLEKAKKTLSDNQKQIFDLIFIQGKNHKEVAAIMGCPVGTVMSRAFSVRKKLSKVNSLVALSV